MRATWAVEVESGVGATPVTGSRLMVLASSASSNSLRTISPR